MEGIDQESDRIVSALEVDICQLKTDGTTIHLIYYHYTRFQVIHHCSTLSG